MAHTKYAEKIGKAVDFIEKNLRSGVSHADAAREAGMSADNFWRVFKKYFGESIGSYIRARRLTIIARGLVSSPRKIAGMAAEYGYESQEIFTRAFKKQFEMTPTKYRQKKKNLYFLERQRITRKVIGHILGGGISLSPKFVNVKAFDICGISGTVSMKNSVIDGSRLCLKFIKSRKQFLKYSGSEIYAFAKALSDNSISEFSSGSEALVVFGYPTGICAKGLYRQHIPGGKYALFMHRGSLDKLALSYEYIFGNWIKRQPQGDMAGFIFERANNKFVIGNPLWVEIYVPIIRKKRGRAHGSRC